VCIREITAAPKEMVVEMINGVKIIKGLSSRLLFDELAGEASTDNFAPVSPWRRNGGENDAQSKASLDISL